MKVITNDSIRELSSYLATKFILPSIITIEAPFLARSEDRSCQAYDDFSSVDNKATLMNCYILDGSSSNLPVLVNIARNVVDSDDVTSYRVRNNDEMLEELTRAIFYGSINSFGV